MSLDNFENFKKLGEGAFSSVFKATRKSDSQCYALKKVKLGSLSVKEKENALNEVRILASLDYPNIIAYKDSFIDEASNTLCIVMELAENGDLLKKIVDHKKQKTKFLEFEIWDALVQIANGLKHLHSANIIHRDLKSANIFISKDGVFKLGDLNVSKVQKKGMAYTQTGTPYYASPEVWKDKPYTFSSDIWSLGCVIYEMAALEPPFKGANMQGLFKSITKGEHPDLPSSYSEELSQVARMLLQVNPVLRPSCEKILEFPSVQKYKNRNSDLNSASPDLLKTIKFDPSLQNLKNKLPNPNYESRGMSAKVKLGQSNSNRDIASRGEIYRHESLHSRESSNVQVGRQVSLEPTDRKRRKNLLKIDADFPEVFNRYQVKAISPDKVDRKIQEIINRQFPDSRNKAMNKIGLLVLDNQRGVKAGQAVKASPTGRDSGVMLNPLFQFN